MRILIVDDDAIVIKSCTRILEGEGFEIKCVDSADKALAIIKESTFDLLLIDVIMPKHGGLYLMKELRKQLSSVPLIVMSGYHTPETVSEVHKLGADQFISKPFRPDELLKTIRQVLGRTVDSKNRSIEKKKTD
jgi:DNA-binding response OmpR family regulator